MFETERKVWIWEQTAIISLYSTDWLVFITETECVYCAVRSTFHVPPTQCIYVFCVDLRTNSDYFTVQRWLVGFYNWDGVRLLRGTSSLFIYNSGLFYSFKWCSNCDSAGEFPLACVSMDTHPISEAHCCSPWFLDHEAMDEVQTRSVHKCH